MVLRADPDIDLDAVAKAAGQGDRATIACLLAVIQSPVNRYCRARIPARRGHVSADDVAQEALLAVFRGLRSYRNAGTGFMAYVYGIAANKVADYYRKQEREGAISVGAVPERPDTGSGPEQEVLRAELRQKVRELLSTLPEAHQEILVHRVIGELTSEEVAGLLSSTAGAVRVAQHRALEKLRRRLSVSW